MDDLSARTVGIMVVVILAVVAILNLDSIINFGRWGGEYIEMRSMQAAASSYSSLRRDGADPTSAADLVNGVSANDSIDGAEHTGLMNARSGRWKGNNYTDAWGNDFQFATDSDGYRYIASGGVDGAIGTDDDIVMYY